MKAPKQFKIKLDNQDNLQELLQEIYNEACKNVEEAQRLINKIEMSTNLNEEVIDGKSKYAKAINDFISTKDKAIGRKLEVAKAMAEVLKRSGNGQQGFTEGAVPDNWEDVVADIPTSIEENKPLEYTLK